MYNSTMPVEVWCDLLEEEGKDVKALREWIKYGLLVESYTYGAGLEQIFGYGSGCSFGSNYAFGSGYGFCNGFGNGSGLGTGHGLGSGHGYGFGFRHRSGYGSGSGYRNN